jgi:sulfur carrier protein
MELRVNGKPRTARAGSTVADLVEELGLRQRQVVAELNGEPVERARFAQTPLEEGDVLEIVRAVAGGSR